MPCPTVRAAIDSPALLQIGECRRKVLMIRTTTAMITSKGKGRGLRISLAKCSDGRPVRPLVERGNGLAVVPIIFLEFNKFRP